MKVIDWRLRPPFKSFKVNKIFEAAQNNVDNPYYSEAARKFDMDLMIKEMDEAGVVLGVAPYRYGQDMSDIDELVNNYNDRFVTLAHIDPYADDPIGDIDRYVVNGKSVGAIIEPGQFFIKRPIPADDRILWPIYEKCEAENIVLTITFGGLYCDSLEFYEPKYIDHVAKMFPNLKMVLTHGAWPYITQICHVCYQRPNVYLSPDFYLMPDNPGHQDYVTAANHFLAKKIIFGSTYPGKTLKYAVEAHLKSGIKEEILPDIMYHNAARLLGLEEAEKTKTVV